jgi:hypothetical protein
VQAREDVRTGKIDAALIIPPQYSRRVYARRKSQLGMVVDNSDQFMSASLEGEMQSLVDALNAPHSGPRWCSDRPRDRRALPLRRIYEVPAAG